MTTQHASILIVSGIQRSAITVSLHLGSQSPDPCCIVCISLLSWTHFWQLLDMVFLSTYKLNFNRDIFDDSTNAQDGLIDVIWDERESIYNTPPQFLKRDNVKSKVSCHSIQNHVVESQNRVIKQQMNYKAQSFLNLFFRWKRSGYKSKERNRKGCC